MARVFTSKVKSKDGELWITIPEGIVDWLSLKENDYVDFSLLPGEIKMKKVDCNEIDRNI